MGNNGKERRKDRKMGGNAGRKIGRNADLWKDFGE
jgi:hypothetical protein